MLIFLKVMYSQSDERGILDALEIKFSSLSNHGERAFNFFFEIIFVGFTLWW